MSERLRRIVVVGGSLAGLRAVEGLRREGYAGAVTLVGAEPHLPYDRPPLSKEILAGRFGPQRCVLASEERLRELDVEFRSGCAAAALNVGDRTVALHCGATVRYDGLVLATGARARRIDAGGMAGVHVVRELGDALALRAELERGPRVVVIGGGLIGCEVAAAARQLGLAVTIVEAGPVLLGRLAGPVAAAAVRALHADSGVDVRCGAAVAGFRGGTRVGEVLLADGTVLPADVVVVGIGARPNDDWLRGSGLTVADGVVADQYCLAAPDIVVAGDLARWSHPRIGRAIRVEHWSNADEQGGVAATNLLRPDAPKPFAPTSSIWSIQYGRRLQMFGHREPAGDEFVLRRPDAEHRFLVLYGHRDRLTGALGLDESRALRGYRDMISARASWPEALGGTAS